MNLPCQACKTADVVRVGTGLGQTIGGAVPRAHLSSDFPAWERAQEKLAWEETPELPLGHVPSAKPEPSLPTVPRSAGPVRRASEPCQAAQTLHGVLSSL